MRSQRHKKRWPTPGHLFRRNDLNTTPQLDQVEAVKVQHLVSGRDEIAFELLAAVGLGIDLCFGPEYRIRPEDQGHTLCFDEPL